MKVTEAKLMTNAEVKAFRDRLKKTHTDKKTNSLDWCCNNEDRIISDHGNFIHDFKKDKYNKYLSSLKKDVDRWNNSLHERNEHIKLAFDIAESLANGLNHKCSCVNEGQLVRRTGPTYDFIGCSKYNQPGCQRETHNFRELYKERCFESEVLQYDEWEPHHEINHTYIKLLTKYNDYPKYVRVSDVYRTLKLNNVDFYCDLSESNFNVGVQASKQSDNEEKTLLKRLELIPNVKVLYQQHFWYRTNKDENWKVGIPDYIIFNDKKVVILDAKKTIENCNLDQINKYLQIVTKAAKKVKDIKSYHILFDRSDATATELQKNQVVTINDINNEFN